MVWFKIDNLVYIILFHFIFFTNLLLNSICVSIVIFYFIYLYNTRSWYKWLPNPNVYLNNVNIVWRNICNTIVKFWCQYLSPEMYLSMSKHKIGYSCGLLWTLCGSLCTVDNTTWHCMLNHEVWFEMTFGLCLSILTKTLYVGFKAVLSKC